MGGFIWTLFVPVALLAGMAYPQAADVRTGAAAFGDWQTDAPGVRRHIKPSDFPAPKTGTDPEAPDFQSKAQVVEPRRGLRRKSRTASLSKSSPADCAASQHAIAPTGDIFLAESGTGRVLVFPATAARSAPAKPEVFAENLERPYGIVFQPPADPQNVYVAAVNQVVRYPYRIFLSQRRHQSEGPGRGGDR